MPTKTLESVKYIVLYNQMYRCSPANFRINSSIASSANYYYKPAVLQLI